MGVNAGHASTVSAHFPFGTRLDILLILSRFLFPQRLVQNRGSLRNLRQSSKHVQNGQKLEWYVIAARAPLCFLPVSLSFPPPGPGGALPRSPPPFRLLWRQSLWACCPVGRAHWVILQLGSLGLGERTEGMRTDRLLSPGGPAWVDEPFQGFLLKFNISGFPGHCFILLPAESEF